MTNDYAFRLGPAWLEARASGALWWPDQGLLVVSDLHLGKSQRLARRGGGLLPPYETRATLDRLAAELAATGARQVLSLGDSFDDPAALTDLPEADRQILSDLMAGRDWHWVEGNHDPGTAPMAAPALAEWRRAGLTFRHMALDTAQADSSDQGPEISGHFHPKARLAGRSHPCFLLSQQRGRLILPAFGTYTGGLACGAPDLARLIDSPDTLAILTGQRARPLPYSAAKGPAAGSVSGFGTRPRASTLSR